MVEFLSQAGATIISFLQFKDWYAKDLTKKEIGAIRKALNDLYFGPDGSLKVLKERGLDSFISVLQRDSEKITSNALDDIVEYARRLDLPIANRNMLRQIHQMKGQARASLVDGLFDRKPYDVELLISEIEKLNELILELDARLYEISLQSR